MKRRLITYHRYLDETLGCNMLIGHLGCALKVRCSRLFRFLLLLHTQNTVGNLILENHQVEFGSVWFEFTDESGFRR